MALTLSEALREARSIPPFDGENEYTVTHYLRDVTTVLSLTPAEGTTTICKVLVNKIRGRAMHIIQQLHEPNFDTIINRLKEEFGVKVTYLNLRNDAMNIKANNIEDLHNKLEKILHTMNTKFTLEGGIDNLYTPSNNSKLIYEIYLQFLPFTVKTLLLQNHIEDLREAFTYFLQNNMLKDIVINNGATYNNKFRNNNQFRNDHFASSENVVYPNENNKHFVSNKNSQNYQNSGNFRNQNANYSGNYRNLISGNRVNNHFENVNYANNRNTNNNSGNFDNHHERNASGDFRRRNYRNFVNTNNSGQFQNNLRNNQNQSVVPMEVDNIAKYENFQLSPLQPTYP